MVRTKYVTGSNGRYMGYKHTAKSVWDQNVDPDSNI